MRKFGFAALKTKEADLMLQTPSRLAKALIEARRQARLASLDPALVPPNVQAAMSVQREVTQAMGAWVAGWKVGHTPDGIPVAAPIYASATHPGGARLRHGPLRKSGIEVEIAILLGKDLPPRQGRPYGRAEILDATQAVLAGIEILASRFPIRRSRISSRSSPTISATAAYLRGDELRDFRTLDLAKLRARLEIDGEVQHDAIGGHAKGDPLVPSSITRTPRATSSAASRPGNSSPPAH